MRGGEKVTQEVLQKKKIIGLRFWRFSAHKHIEILQITSIGSGTNKTKLYKVKAFYNVNDAKSEDCEKTNEVMPITGWTGGNSRLFFLFLNAAIVCTRLL